MSDYIIAASKILFAFFVLVGARLVGPDCSDVAGRQGGHAHKPCTLRDLAPGLRCTNEPKQTPEVVFVRRLRRGGHQLVGHIADRSLEMQHAAEGPDFLRRRAKPLAVIQRHPNRPRGMEEMRTLRAPA